jgi:hypothetical protein
MSAVGIILLIAGVIQLIAGVVMIAKGGAVPLIQGLLSVVIGGFTLKAAGAFRQIISSTGDDMGCLMRALGTLRDLYRLQVVAVVAALVFGIVLAVLMPLILH